MNTLLVISGTIRYQFQAQDPDGDNVKFYLDPGQAKPSKGHASVTTNGLFTYTPCSDCYGEDTITILGKILFPFIVTKHSVL